MPGMNRRGPEGEGPMSGRGRGRCNPSNRASNYLDTSERAGMSTPSGKVKAEEGVKVKVWARVPVGTRFLEEDWARVKVKARE